MRKYVMFKRLKVAGGQPHKRKHEVRVLTRLTSFMRFVGIRRPEDFRTVARAHAIAWRKTLEKRKLAPATVRRKLSALSDLYDYLCEKNAVPDNPVHGVERPKEGANQGKTPAISDSQAAALLDAPPLHTLKGKRDRAILAVFLFHAVRRAELCDLRVRDYGDREGIKHLTIHGKGGKIRFIEGAQPNRGRIGLSRSSIPDGVPFAPSATVHFP